MSEIPIKGTDRYVISNLVSTKRVTLGTEGQNIIETIVNFPKSKADLSILLNAIRNSHTGLTHQDIDTMVEKIRRLMTSCQQRRLEEYERMGWWEYTEADAHSDAYR